MSVLGGSPIRGSAPMRWLEGRTARERLLLGAGLALALVTVGHQQLWQPLVAERAAALAEIDRLERAIVLVRAAGPRLQLGAGRELAPPQTAIATTAPGHGLAIRRVEPEGAQTRVVLENVAFDGLLAWLVELESVHELRVAAIEMDRRPEPGFVSARVTLER